MTSLPDPLLITYLLYSRKFGYVDFATAEDVEKAIKLTGKKVLGFEIKIEKANTAAEKNKNAESKKGISFVNIEIVCVLIMFAKCSVCFTINFFFTIFFF